MKKPKVYRKGDIVGTIKDKNLLDVIDAAVQIHRCLWRSVFDKLAVEQDARHGKEFHINHETGVVTVAGERIYI